MLSFKNNKKDPELINADKIILGIGVLAITLPFIVHISAGDLPNCVEGDLMHSISAYYHTDAQNVLVGLICALSFSFFAYNGHSSIDMVLSRIAAFSALGVAFIPTVIFPGEYICINGEDNCLREYAHLACAIILLLTMAIFSLVVFTHREEGDVIASWKKYTYKACGHLIIGSMVICAIYMMVLKGNYPKLDAVKPIFWLETLCLTSFGVSWLVKSKLMEKSSLTNDQS